MKRILCAVLSVLMIAGLLSGCGGDKEKQVGNLFKKDVLKSSGLDFGGLKMPLSKNGDTITWAVTSEEITLNDKWVPQKLRELTGVNLQLTVLSPSTKTEKVNTMVASKNLCDIMTFGERVANDLAAQGAIACVEDYIDDLPNFKSIFVDREDTPRIFKSYPMKDGRLYGFYGYDYNRDINTGVMMYRKDIFDKLGIEMWNSPETFYQALKKIKEAYPDSIPFANKTKLGFIASMAKTWGVDGNAVFYDERDKKWKYGSLTEEFREVLDFVKKLYDEGLVDPEFATRTQADWTSLMTAKNKSYVTLDWIGRMEMFYEQTKDSIPEYDLRFANPVGPTQQYPTNSQLCWARYVKKQDPAREKMAFQLLDTVLSPGGKQLITMGIEGETFEFDDNGKAVHPEFGGRTPQMNELIQKYGMFIEDMYLSFDRRSSYFNFSEREQEAQDFAKDPSNMLPLAPILAFTPEEKIEINDLNPPLAKAGEEFIMSYILTGACSDDDWEAWKKKTENLGVNRLIEIYNNAQARYDAQ